MKKLLLGVALAVFAPTGLIAEDGEREFRCNRLYEQPGSGDVFSIRTKVSAHNENEAISLCEVAYDTTTLFGMIWGNVGRTKTEENVFIRTPIYLPRLDDQPAVVAQRGG